MPDAPAEQAAGLRQIIRICEVLLVVFPVLVLLLALTGTPPGFLPGFALGELLLFLGVRGLRRSALLRSP